MSKRKGRVLTEAEKQARGLAELRKSYSFEFDFLPDPAVRTEAALMYGEAHDSPLYQRVVLHMREHHAELSEISPLWIYVFLAHHYHYRLEAEAAAVAQQPR
jgi:hypothetical protein